MNSFERNRYFYGKLLTAADFETEQRYFNGKRGLINRFLFGGGVVSGMEVTAADDSRIVVEAGFALDYEGNELIIPQSSVKKLSELKGFDLLDKSADGGVKSVYLCAEYREEQAEPIHSVMKNAADDENDGPEHNKIKESYGLFLTENAPDVPDENRGEASFEERLSERRTLYLARLYVILTPDYYIIDRVEPLNSKLPFTETPPAAAPYNHEDVKRFCPESECPAGRFPLMKFGTAKVTVPEGAVKGKVYYSRDIPHFLGLGTVFINAGLLDGDEALYGDLPQSGAYFKWGAVLDKTRGLFKIAVKIIKNAPPQTLDFCWSAVKQREPPANRTPALAISPDVGYVAPFETIAFRASSGDGGLNPGELIWSVNPPEIGRISKNGVFTAGGGEGFCEIRAELAAEREFNAAAFVVIGEKK
ncbi:MAG: hypothetical protein LBI38_02795 [Oscillospiraceae bacterium]|jgi:hypothetical protein|nr:hypothetical protein [Oscillospiraceae bacterium]